MTEELRAATDTELIVLVRAGDAAAYEELFLRHRDVALRYARRIADSARADDLCAEAFAKILDLLQRGKGPDVAFRAYLLTTVRTSHLNSVRSHGREDLVPDHEPIARMVPVIEDPGVRFDRSAICRAFEQLPERWQAALWLTTVEGYSHDQVSAHLGINPNAVASLTFRARAGLRDAYLAQHLLEITDPRCRNIVEHLPAYVRDRLAPRRRQAIGEHLDSCAPCSAAALELSDVEMSLGAVLAPLALAGFAVSSAPSVGLLGAALLPLKTLGSKIAALGPQTAAGVVAVGLAAGLGLTAAHQGSSTPRPASQAAPSDPLGSTPPTASSPAASAPAHPRAASTPSPAPLPRPVPGTPDPAPLPAPARGSRPTTAATAPAVRVTRPEGRPEPSALGTPVTTSQGTLLGRWDHIALPVLHVPRGAVLVVTTDRTVRAVAPTTETNGWTCERPALHLLAGGLLARSRTVCTARRDGAGTVSFAFQVAPGARLTAVLTGPSQTPRSRTAMLRPPLL
ncbi:RNA polymerase sigma factor (sigma-70 family) [Marmoricola sp. OAE513]|uniref:sigma-70 family RNA polymerase sigma factor n=1 Tax=Marmoricola sp. OAE513 TaxID=2817894 RepID=UPI001AE70A7B